MRIVNNTTLDNILLARVVNGAWPPGLRWEPLTLVFQWAEGPVIAGWAFDRDVAFPGSEPHAYIKVGRKLIFPQYPPPLARTYNGKIIRPAKRGWTVQLRTLEESLVYVVAHELGHLRYGSSERLAHAWGMRMIRKYRRIPLPAPIVMKSAA